MPVGMASNHRLERFTAEEKLEEFDLPPIPESSR